MKFIFPQNYNFKTKLFGIFDYPTAILNIILWIIVFIFTKLFIYDLFTKFIIFIIVCLPIFFISFIGIGQENIIYVFSYIFSFYKRDKVYLYKKQE